MTGPIEVDVNQRPHRRPGRDPAQGQRHRLDVAARRSHSLRDDVLPATIGKVPGVTYAVTGGTAASADENALLKHSAPLVFGFVLTFAFILLLVSFRSIVIAAKAIVLNLLSVGAAYGVLVLVFQWGWGEGLLNFRSNGGDRSVAADLHVRDPVRALDGLPRVHPEPDPRGVRPGHEDRGRGRHGIKTTAGVVTSAAVVMVGVFSIFATLPIVDMKEMGIGLAAAVLIDATIVRAVLLPATMKLLGDWNWYLPNWLGWLPRLDHGAGIVAPVPVAAAAAALQMSA